MASQLRDHMRKYQSLRVNLGSGALKGSLSRPASALARSGTSTPDCTRAAVAVRPLVQEPEDLCAQNEEKNLPSMDDIQRQMREQMLWDLARNPETIDGAAERESIAQIVEKVPTCRPYHPWTLTGQLRRKPNLQRRHRTWTRL